MALLPISLRQICDVNGKPILSARLFVYVTGGSTPADIFASADLDPARKLAWPTPVDGNGYLPAVWIGQGAVDIEITDGSSLSPPGAVLLAAQDLPGDPAPAATPAFDPLRQYKTGDYIFNASSGGRDGAVAANGGTIGSAASGASNRANADCEALFVVLWEGRTDLAVSSGRGGTAEGDFAAGKTIALPDLNSRFPAFVAAGSPSGNLLAAGLQDPASPPGVLLGSFGGEATHVLLEAELATHTHTATFTGDAVGNHTHVADCGTDAPDHDHSLGTVRKIINSAQSSQTGQIASFYAVPDGEGIGSNSPTSGAVARHQHTVGIEPAGAFTPTGEIAIANDGSSAAHNCLPPFVVAGAAYIKL